MVVMARAIQDAEQPFRVWWVADLDALLKRNTCAKRKLASKCKVDCVKLLLF